MKEILLIITGSVAAFKSLELIRKFTKHGVKIKVILSKGGEAFVTPLSVSALSGYEVYTEDTYKMEHISLSRNIDAIIICPASASFINKLAGGAGGELSLDLMLARKADIPVIIAPAMNVEMWKNKTTKESVKKLEEQGALILNPIKGELLCKEEGEGKLAEVDFIFDETIKYYEFRNRLKGKKFLVTNGGTVEKIDDVRFISNFSSGLQGALIIKEILFQGGEVITVEGRTSYNLTLPKKNLTLIKVLSAKEMYNAVIEVIKNNKIEAFFAVAAVADFAVKNKVIGKIKKDKMPVLEFEENPDILASVSVLIKNKPSKIIGFAAEEEENLLKNGRAKLEKKKCDIIFSNALCFENDFTKGFIISKNTSEYFEGKKKELAFKLILEV